MRFAKTGYLVASLLLLMSASGLGYEYKKNWIPIVFIVVWTIVTIIMVLLNGGKIFMTKKRKLREEKQETKKKPAKKSPAKDDEPLDDFPDIEVTVDEKQEQNSGETEGDRLFDAPRKERAIPGFEMDAGGDSEDDKVDDTVFSEDVKDDNIQDVADVESPKEKRPIPRSRDIQMIVGEINELKQQIQKREQEILKVMGVK